LTYPISLVARELGLYFTTLKNRLAVDCKSESGITDKSESFVEVKVLSESEFLHNFYLTFYFLCDNFSFQEQNEIEELNR
jgi:hypothetical protein